MIRSFLFHISALPFLWFWCFFEWIVHIFFCDFIFASHGCCNFLWKLLRFEHGQNLSLVRVYILKSFQFKKKICGSYTTTYWISECTKMYIIGGQNFMNNLKYIPKTYQFWLNFKSHFLTNISFLQMKEFITPTYWILITHLGLYYFTVQKNLKYHDIYQVS